jgi:hypothetical protein
MAHFTVAPGGTWGFHGAWQLELMQAIRRGSGMNIDFHYGVIYVVSRLAGMKQQDAAIVAHACQYVDDATTDGVHEFKGGDTFERFASARAVLDYSNFEDALERGSDRRSVSRPGLRR